jgi:heme exporter protein D
VRVPISAIILTIGRVERRRAIGDQARNDVDRTRRLERVDDGGAVVRRLWPSSNKERAALSGVAQEQARRFPLRIDPAQPTQPRLVRARKHVGQTRFS